MITELEKKALIEIFPQKYNLSELRPAVQLIEKMLLWDPSKRISAADALNDPFFTNPTKSLSRSSNSKK
jgi:serine/threonine protein kinase